MTRKEVLISDELCILGAGFSILGVEKGVCGGDKYDLFIVLVVAPPGQACMVSGALHNSEEVQPAREPDFGKRRARMGLAVASRIHGARRQSRAIAHGRRSVTCRGLARRSDWRIYDSSLRRKSIAASRQDSVCTSSVT
jgi:hypothetical protein